MHAFQLSFITVIIQAAKLAVRETKFYESLTYVPYEARGYRAKLQRQEYTERRMQDNNNIHTL